MMHIMAPRGAVVLLLVAPTRRRVPYRMLLETQRNQGGRGGCSPDRMLLETQSNQGGSGGCSPDRMLLETHGNQGGSGGCSQ